MPIYFYSTRNKYGEFSNFAAYGIQLDDQWWATVEHYFQAQKFIDTDYKERIRLAKTPKYAATLGRSRTMPLRTDWEQVKDEVMYQAVLRKFSTHKKLTTLLLSTGEEDIIEKTTGDYYWGCGTKGTGRNQLGVTLCQVRDVLREKVAAL